MTEHWELLPHDADMDVRGFGAPRERAFEQAALALTAVIAEPTQTEEAPGAYKEVEAVVDATEAAGLARKVAPR